MSYTLTIRSAPAGTQKRGGTFSGPGHMWYELRGPGQKVISRGWSSTADNNAHKNLNLHDNERG
ncbi:hypothetical protein [Eikenella corrodens]|uniref:hypothetical protein n=1 Tax=Eikenella corrodens TaxID=539 RepID=UPI0012AC7F31|nr:hypothetical protein [Eikenella corrodens]